MTQKITYKSAVAELEAILHAIESDEIDVDELTVKVKRASELIKICKGKLRTAEAAIDQVFDEIDCDTDTPEVKQTTGKPAGGAAKVPGAGKAAPGNMGIYRHNSEHDDDELPF
jgi:exodeoxyribonuclease VII small subunit